MSHPPPTTMPLRRSRSDESDQQQLQFQMEEELEHQHQQHEHSSSQRRSSVDHEIAAATREVDEIDADETRETTTSIEIERAESPTIEGEEDLESALLNDQARAASATTTATTAAMSIPVDPAAYQPRRASVCSSGLSVGDFELLSVVGRGAYGKVFLVKRKISGRHYAMKVVRKSEAIRKNVVANMKAERDVLEAVRHPFIVNLRFAFQSASKLYLCMDFIGGGELFTRLNDSRDHALPVKDCRFYAAELVLALEHLHKLDIIYRDLKPENILLTKEGHITLTDFGFAKERIDKNDSGTRSFCGTLHYMSPELVNGSDHGKGADWWALGCVLHEMLTGSTPFAGNNRKVIQDNILSAPLKLPKYLDQPTKSILTELLRRPIHKRLGCGVDGAAAIKRHPFFSGVDWIALGKKQVTPPFVPAVSHDQDVSHFDPKFTQERAVDTPLTPTQMATILSGQGTSPATFHTADATFAGFSYHREHTPMASPFLKPMNMEQPLKTRTTSAGSTTLGSPRALSGLPPLHNHVPDHLELPLGARSNSQTASTSSTPTISETSRSCLTAVSPPISTMSVFAAAKETATPTPQPIVSATTPTLPVTAATTSSTATTTTASTSSPNHKLKKPKPVKAAAVLSPPTTSTTTMPRSECESKEQIQTISPAVTSPPAIRILGGIKQLTPTSGLSNPVLSQAPAPTKMTAPATKTLSAAAPAFVPGSVFSMTPNRVTTNAIPKQPIASATIIPPTPIIPIKAIQSLPSNQVAAAVVVPPVPTPSAAVVNSSPAIAPVGPSTSLNSVHVLSTPAAPSSTSSVIATKVTLPTAQRIGEHSSTALNKPILPSSNPLGPPRWGVQKTAAPPIPTPLIATPNAPTVKPSSASSTATLQPVVVPPSNQLPPSTLIQPTDSSQPIPSPPVVTSTNDFPSLTTTAPKPLTNSQPPRTSAWGIKRI